MICCSRAALPRALECRHKFVRKYSGQISSSASSISVAEFEGICRAEMPMVAEMGIVCERLSFGRATFRLPARASHVRPGGTLAGPTLMALADLTMYAATLSTVGKEPLAVTTNLNINFLRKPPVTDVIAEGRVLKSGSRLVVSEVSIFCESNPGDLVAHCTGTYSIPPVRLTSAAVSAAAASSSTS
jgi:uncharacterized protein (TIGR00369 family)